MEHATGEDAVVPSMSPFTDVQEEEEEIDETVADELEYCDDDKEDGQGIYLTADAADDLYLRGTRGDGDEDGTVAEAPTRVWKVDPNFGQYHFQCTYRALRYPRSMYLEMD